MSTATKSKLFSTANLTRMAILAAVSSVLFLIEIPIGMPIYKLDLSNLPVLIGAFAMGTLPGAIILAVKDLIGLLHSSSGGIGELADFIMGLAMIVPASLIYQRSKTRKGALIGMLVGTVCAIIAGVLMNKWVMFPFYMNAFHINMEQLIGMVNWNGVDSEWKVLLMVTAPFNLIKCGVISAVTYFVYKPLSPLLH